MDKKILATTSLAGCFGCHMSLLDIDERILDLIELVEFNKSPIDDIKTFTKHCDIGIVEGGCATSEDVHVLKDFRKNSGNWSRWITSSPAVLPRRTSSGTHLRL